MKDLTDEEFGRLTVIGFDRREGKRYFWKCQCSCKDKTIIIVGRENLKNGSTKSCGCLALEKIKNNKYNLKHGMSSTQIYHSWNSMKMRCDNIKDKRYKDYGLLEITYDKSWKTFNGFYKEMKFKYAYAKKKYRVELKIKNNPLTLERKDVNGNYCFDNCEFIPRNKQNGNRKNNKWFEAISPEGKEYISKNYSAFSKEHNLLKTNIYRCLHNKQNNHKGWTFVYLTEEEINEKT